MRGHYKKATILLEDVDLPEDYDPAKIDPERLKRYARLLVSGGTAHALVVWAKPGGRYGLLHGLNVYLVSLAGNITRRNALGVSVAEPPSAALLAAMRRGFLRGRSARDGWHRLKRM